MQDPGDETTFDPAEADTVSALAEAADAMFGPEMPAESADDWTTQGGQTPEVLTLIEIEKQLQRLETVAADPQVAPMQKVMVADDVLQGITVVLGMAFSGDVQMLVLNTLARYREVKGLR